MIADDVEARTGGETEGGGDSVHAGKADRIGPVAEVDRERRRLDARLVHGAIGDPQVGQRIGATRGGDREGVGDLVGAGQGQRVVARAGIHGHRGGRVVALQVDDVVARAGPDRDRVRDGVGAGQGDLVVPAARIEGVAGGLDPAVQGDDVVGAAGDELHRPRDVVAADEIGRVDAVAEVDRQRAGRDVGRGGVGQGVDAGAAHDREGASDAIDAVQRQVVPAGPGPGGDLHGAGRVAALEVDPVVARAGADRQGVPRLVGAGEREAVIPLARVEGEAAGIDGARQADDVGTAQRRELHGIGHDIGAAEPDRVRAGPESDRHRIRADLGLARVAADHLRVDEGVAARTGADDQRAGGIGAHHRDRVVALAGAQLDGAVACDRSFDDRRRARPSADGALTRREGAVQHDLVAVATGLDQDRGTDEGAGQRDLGGRVVGRSARAEVRAQGDGALRLHDRARLDDEVVAGVQRHRAAGREDRDAGLDGQVVARRTRFAGLLDDVAGRDDVLVDRQRARRADADPAPRRLQTRGVAGDAADAQAADVPQPDVAVDRAGFETTILVASEAAHVGDDALGIRADAAGGDEIGLAGTEVGAAAGGLVVVGRSVEDAAGDRRDEGRALRVGADAGEVEIARTLQHVEVAQAALERDDTIRRAIDVAVDLELVASHADAVEGGERDRVAAHIGTARTGHRCGVDVAWVGEIARVEDRGLGRQNHVTLGGDGQHLHAGFRLSQDDVARSAGPDGAGQLHLDGVALGADRAGGLQVDVGCDDLVGVRVDTVEDAAPVRDEGDVAALREGGFQVQIAVAGGDEDVARRTDCQGRARRQIDADHPRRSADAAVPAFKDGVAALDVHRIRRAAVEQARGGLQADLLAGDRFHAVHGQQGGGVDEDLGVRRHVEGAGALDDDRLALLDEQLGDLIERIAGILGRLEQHHAAGALRLQRASALEDERRGARLLDGEAGVLGGRVTGRYAEGAGDADQHAVREAVAEEIARRAGDHGHTGPVGGTHAHIHGDAGLGHEELRRLEPDHGAVDGRDAVDARGGRAGVGGGARDVERAADRVGAVPRRAVGAGQNTLVARRIVAEADGQGRRSRLEQVEGDFGGHARRLTGDGDADPDIDVAGDALAAEDLVDGDDVPDDADDLVAHRGLGRSIRRHTSDVERTVVELAVLVEEGTRIPVRAILADHGAVAAGLAEDDVGGDRSLREEDEVAALGGAEIDLLIRGERRGTGADIDQAGSAHGADIARRHDLDVGTLDDRVLLVDDRAGRLLEQPLADGAQQLFLRPALDAGVDGIGRRLVDEEGGRRLAAGRQGVRVGRVGRVVGARQAVEEGVERAVLRRQRRRSQILRRGAGRVDGG